MLSLTVTDIPLFMSRLLSSDVFDHFLVTEAALTTFVTFHVDGTMHPDYFDSDEQENSGYASWQLLRPHFHELIRGSRKPLAFRIVFRLAGYNVQKFIAANHLPFSEQDIAGLFLNIYYDGSSITCTTGSSLRIFTLDKSLDHLWDELIVRLFKQKHLPFC